MFKKRNIREVAVTAIALVIYWVFASAITANVPMVARYGEGRLFKEGNGGKSEWLK